MLNEMNKVILLLWPLLLSLMPKVVQGRTIIPPKVTIEPQPPQPLGCCYGDQQYSNKDVVLTQPKVCLRLVCNNGIIEPDYLGEPGQTDCCEFDGLLYASGSQLPLQCFQFFCRSGTWVTNGTIEECCKHCHFYNDPHFVTFDRYPYDWFGTCNYSIAQTGFSYYPNIGVFSDFVPCKGLGSCLSRTTFRDNPNTIITLDSGMIFNIQVNGDLQTVQSPGVQHVEASDGIHPVLVWKTGSCIALVGSSKLSILHCPDRLDIWTHPTHSGDLYGLCGHFNSYQDDDFTNRNSIIDPLTPYPLAFPTSWVTLDQSDPACNTPCPTCLTPGAKADPPCKADAALKATYLDKCRIALQTYSVSSFALAYHAESCAVDICLMYQNGEDDTDVQDWLRKVGNILQISQFIETKLLGDPCDKPCTKILNPVCGTDGKTYSNKCLLDIANCKNPCIELAYVGTCNRTCPIQICTLEYRPICGTNGVTYSNPCGLAAAQCNDPCIRMAYVGECATLQCNSICPAIYLPVCGSGITYPNRCELDNARCRNPCIEFTNEGICNRTCPIQICTLEYRPICGTNGVTYSNPCGLAAAQCNDPCIRMAHVGECATLQCNSICPAIFIPVCGSGITYPNRCELDNARCRNPCIEFKNEGICSSECPRIFCTKELIPVCGTDGITYNNLCLLEQAQCNNPCIKLSHNGSCSGRAYLSVDARASLEPAVKEVEIGKEPPPTQTLTAQACDCIRQKRPLIKQAVKDFDFLHWLMNDVYAKAALANTRFGRARPFDSTSDGNLENTHHLPLWIKLKDSLNVAYFAMKDMHDLIKSGRIAGDLPEVEETPLASTPAENVTNLCPQNEINAVFKLLNDNFNEVIHVRADLDNGVVPPFVVTEIMENMPLAISALMETEANFKDLVERLNSRC